MHILMHELLARGGVLVTVARTQGSAPREPGAWMCVFADSVVGTIGGGHLEHQAIAHARALLAGKPGGTRRGYTLGPSLGQCCGGRVELEFERVGLADARALALRLAPRLAPLALFGGGHVGRAIIQALAPLPYRVTWIDSRDEIFPAQVSANVECEQSDPVQAAVPHLPSQSRVLIMSFSHAEDLDVVAACLVRLRERDDLPYVGLIGSNTKWATFRHRLEQRGFTQAELARIICPIGVAGISGKQPAVIAASAVAQILQIAPP
jgi:xanthine dehydrogenase accessory factor